MKYCHLQQNGWILRISCYKKWVKQKKSRTIWFHSHVGYKTKGNKWSNKANKQKLIDTDNSRVVTRGKGDKRGQICGDGRRLDFGWGTHNRIYRWYICCIIELYTWNLYYFMTNVTPINVIKMFFKKKYFCPKFMIFQKKNGF